MTKLEQLKKELSTLLENHSYTTILIILAQLLEEKAISLELRNSKSSLISFWREYAQKIRKILA